MRTRTTKRPDRRFRRGVTLIEAVMSLLIIAVMLVAALRTVGSTARARQVNLTRRRGAALAEQVLAELLPVSYSEPSGSGVFGPESGENTGDRSNFDDVDDFHDWSASPPQAADGSVLPGLAGWSRRVTVEYVAPDAPDNTVGSDQGLKRVTVTVTDPQGRQITAGALRSRYGIYDYAPSEETTYVSSVGVELQVGSDAAARVVSGAHPLNRVTTEGQ